MHATIFEVKSLTSTLILHLDSISLVCVSSVMRLINHIVMVWFVVSCWEPNWATTAGITTLQGLQHEALGHWMGSYWGTYLTTTSQQTECGTTHTNQLCRATGVARGTNKMNSHTGVPWCSKFRALVTFDTGYSLWVANTQCSAGILGLPCAQECAPE